MIEFIYKTLTTGQKEFEYLVVKKDIGAVMLDFALGEDSPLASAHEKRPKMGSDHANPPLKFLVLAVSHIVRNC